MPAIYNARELSIGGGVPNIFPIFNENVTRANVSIINSYPQNNGGVRSWSELVNDTSSISVNADDGDISNLRENGTDLSLSRTYITYDVTDFITNYGVISGFQISFNPFSDSIPSSFDPFKVKAFQAGSGSLVGDVSEYSLYKTEGEIVFSNEVTVEYPSVEFDEIGAFFIYFNSTAIAYINANPIFTIGVIGEYDYNNIAPENNIDNQFNLNGNGGSPSYPDGQVG
jgi:hypothetical protein